MWFLVNQEGYFAIGGPNANVYFEEFKQRGALVAARES